MQDSIPLPLQLLRATLLELDKCSKLSHENTLTSDHFRAWLLSPMTNEVGEVKVGSQDVERLVEHCLSAIKGLFAHYRRLVEVNSRVSEDLKLEKDRLDMLLAGEKGSEREVRERSGSMSAFESESEMDGSLDDFDADHGY